MCTSLPTHPVAASLEEGARARLATRANSTRSVTASRRVGPSRAVIVLAIPSRFHNRSRTHAPPNARDAVNDNPAWPVAATPGAASAPSRRDREPMSRSTAARSRSSARPKLYRTRIFDAFAAGSQVLWASWR